VTLRLSFSTGALYHLPLRTTFALAHEAGFAGVELVYGPEVAQHGATPIQRLSQEYSLPVLSVHPSVVPYPGYNRVTHILPRLVSLAECLDCPLVVLHVPKVSALEESRGKEFVEVLLRERARCSSGLQIAVENAGFYRPSDARFILHNVFQLRDLADRYDLPVTFDTSHAGTSPYGVLGAYDILRRRVVNVHFSDLRPRRIRPDWRPLYTILSHHQMPGEGVLPLAEFVRALLADGYAGIFTLEVSPTAIRVWNLAQARQLLVQAIQFVRQLEASGKNSPPADPTTDRRVVGLPADNGRPITGLADPGLWGIGLPRAG
jgi:sugar phosphate isomerase/epimerase